MERGVLVFSNRIPYPGANHVAPPAAKDEKEYRTRSPPRRNRRSSGSSRKPLGVFLLFIFIKYYH
jgi:hypothetical protein